MLLVKTKLGQSKIHGIGLFADELIPMGRIIFKEDGCPELEQGVK
jgi:hypothetical protein